MTAEAPPTPPLTKTLIPQDLHDREYLKPWMDKPWTPEVAGELFKKLDGAETLIGRKIGIPDEKAKPEEVEKFYSSLRPAKADDYEFKLGDKPDEAFIKEMRAAAHTAGLSKAQMAKFVEGLAPGMQARQKAQADAAAAQDAEFGSLVAKVNADGKAVGRVQAALKEFAPEEFKPFIGGLDNKSLAVLTGVVNAILVKYASEDDINNLGTGNGAGGGSDRETLEKEAITLQAHPSFRDWQHPDHKKTTARVKEIYAHPAFKK